MNLIEYLIQEDAIGNSSKRSTVASEILKEKIKATVAVYPPSKSGDTQQLIRQAMKQETGVRQITPLNLPEYKAELVKLAAGQDADFDVLRRIDICKPLKAGKKMVNAKPHLEYIKAIISRVGGSAECKVIMNACISAAQESADTPFVVIDGALALKTNETPIANKTFANWISSIKKDQ